MSDYPLTSPEEPLRYPQKELGFDNGKTDDAGLEIDPASSFPWPDDPDERIWAPVYMSLNEYTALLSAVDVGASIAWTNDALLVYYILVRNYAGGAMEFCEKVADCITNSDAVKEALAALMLEDGPVQDAIDDIARHGSPLSGTVTTAPITADCDYDVLFAGITSIVDTMHNNNKDFLEVMALAATQTERLSTAISALPIIGILPVDEIIGWVGKMQAEVLTNYDAEWTTSVKDEYRCGLFCIAKDKEDCSLNYDDIIQFVTDRLGATLDPLHLLESLVQYTILGTWSGTTVVDIMMLNQVNIWKVAGEWLGSVIRTLEATAKLGQDTPDPDWSILCTDCPDEPLLTLYNLNSSTFELQTPDNPIEWLGGNTYRVTTWTGTGDNSFVIATGYVGSGIDPADWPRMSISDCVIVAGSNVAPVGGNLNPETNVVYKYAAWTTAQGAHTVEFTAVPYP